MKYHCPIDTTILKEVTPKAHTCVNGHLWDIFEDNTLLTFRQHSFVIERKGKVTIEGPVS